MRKYWCFISGIAGETNFRFEFGGWMDEYSEIKRDSNFDEAQVVKYEVRQKVTGKEPFLYYGGKHDMWIEKNVFF